MIAMRDIERQYGELREKMELALLTTAASGKYIQGEEVGRLEQRLANYVGRRHCISCANGTDALLLSLMAIGVGEGDAVFVPDFTFFATGEVVSRQGALPVFVDVTAERYSLSYEDLREKYERVKEESGYRPRAIIAVDLFGMPADYEEIERFAREKGLILIEDGAQGFGGAIGGRRACSFGEISTSSFFPSKPLGCYGDGGAVFTDSETWAKAIRSLAQHGRGEEKYDNERIGMNSRLDAIQASVLEVKMDAFEDKELTLVNAIAARYTEAFGQLPIGLPEVPKGYRSSWAQYTIRVADKKSRERIQRQLKDNDISSAIYYPKTLSQQRAFTKLRYRTEGETAKALTETVLSIPIHPYLTESEQEKIIATIKSTF